MSISTLPDLCLLVIFDHLPVSDLLKVNLVCERWASLQTTACNRRKELTVLVGQDPESHVVKSKFLNPNGRLAPTPVRTYLLYPWINQEIVDFLVNRFPNVESLQVVIHNIPTTSVVKVIDLLTSYSSSLRSLKLSFKFMGKESAEPVERRLRGLFQSINALALLQHLTLEIYFFFNFEQLDLPILDRLRSFNFISIDRANMVMNSLRQFAEPNRTLRKIGLLNPIREQECLDRFLAFENPTRFTHLQLEMTWTDVVPFATFCNRFTSLTYVHIDIGNLSLVQLTNSMKPLIHLTHLALTLDFVLHHSPLSQEDSVPSDQLAPLSSVKQLDLSLVLSSHKDLGSVHFGNIFPSVRSVSIEHSYIECTICNFETFEAIDEEMKTACVRWLVIPWIEQCKQLTKLMTVSAFRRLPVYWPIAD